jgi:DNA invertase Pin-like site-specific DNA recombinase
MSSLRAAIAIRVSPRPRENIKYSPELQESKCRDWSSANGHEVVVVVRDILVSGASASRFDSIMRVMDEHSPDLFVVSDLSRWTRERPSRFWAIKAILEDRGVQLVSVDEPHLSSGLPFTDTITTATVEMNYEQRKISNAKTSAGVRKAWAAGKRWGHAFGWSWDPKLREWSQDVGLIESFYRDWIDGNLSRSEIERKYNIPRTRARAFIGAKSQRDIVPELWEQAQHVRHPRGRRSDAGRSSIYRGMLHCPFCGSVLSTSGRWGMYRCLNYNRSPHDWWNITAPLHISPVVASVLAKLNIVPPISPSDLEGQAVAPVGKPVDLNKEQDRLTLSWIRGRISDEAYDRALKDLDRRKEALPPEPRPIAQRMEIINSLAAMDLSRQDREYGDTVNAMLREVLTIELLADRSCIVRVREPYTPWMV